VTRHPGPLGLFAFAGTGVANTLLTWLLYVLLWWLGLGTAVAYVVSFAAGIVLSGMLNIRPVFGVRPTTSAYLRYGMIYLLIAALGLLLVKVMEELGMTAALAPLLALPITVPAAYLLIGRVFRHPLAR
jgi:putative flippase GtrA